MSFRSAADGYVQVTASETTTHRVFGLSNGDSNQSYTDIDFGLYMAAGSVCVNEGGIGRGCFGAYAPGDVLRVVATGGQVKYWRNGIVFYTSTLAPSYPLLVDTSLFTPGATINSAIISTSSGGANNPNGLSMTQTYPAGSPGTNAVAAAKTEYFWPAIKAAFEVL